MAPHAAPGVDARFTPVEDVLAHLDAQQHRRFIKTHSPADCVPIFEECRYVTVYRDGRDALMSWANHRGAMRPEVIDFLNASAAEEGLPLLPPWDGEMRRLAAFLGIEVPEDLWPAAVERCGLSEMREEARGAGRIDMVFENGADTFFHKGTNGRWRDVLTPEQLDRYDALVADTLPADAAAWLEAGSLATGSRPHEP